ncbi:MAG: leucine-rich repeat domain-containing protein [Flavobacteriaceae bacterium]|nr:leucine-rich repeat domain-containing protein [Flavobacteriaceae bacterium]
MILFSCNRNTAGGVDICHYDKKTGMWQTITVNKNKVQKHLDHGDPVGGGCEEYTFVEDAIFEEFLFDLGYDENIDNLILTSNIDSITHLNIEGRPDQKIKNLVGIGAFKNLQVLNCRGNDLVALDLSKNTNLRELYCYDNKITKLDLSNNINLEILFCGSNKLSDLTVSKNANLKELNCYNNELQGLDISNNVNLERLWVQVNQLTNLDLSKNIKLTTLHCNHNVLLENLDLKNNSNLEVLYCHHTGLTTLDVSNNQKLKTLHCNDNKLNNLNLKNGKNILLKSAEFKINNNPYLKCVEVDHKGWSDLHWTYKNTITRFSTDCY